MSVNRRCDGIEKVTRHVNDHINLGPVVLAGVGSNVPSHMVWSTATPIEMRVPSELCSKAEVSARIMSSILTFGPSLEAF